MPRISRCSKAESSVGSTVVYLETIMKEQQSTLYFDGQFWNSVSLSATRPTVSRRSDRVRRTALRCGF